MTREFRTFAEALDHLAHRSKKTLLEMADRIGRKANYLRKATSQYDDAHPFRADLIVPLTLASADDPDERNYAVVDYIAREAGGVFFRVPASVVKRGLTADALREFGEYLQAVADGSADGKYSPEEVARIRKQGMDVVAAILADIELTQQQVTKPTAIADRRAHA